jgi:thioesterase domain-containing protein
VELALSVEQAFHFNLPISALLHAPTISALAEVLRSGNAPAAPRWSSLVPIQTQGQRPPLFCVHADGGILFYYAFAQKMSPGQPIYGIQARGLLGQTEALHTRLEDIAAEYVAEVRTVQPRGPYYFCAFSLGGAFIFEMAQQLRAAGESVAFLGMLDAYGPDYPKRLPGKSVVHYKVSVHRNTLRLHDFAGQVAYLQRRVRKRSEIIYAYLMGPLYNRLRWPMPQALRYNYVRQILNQAADAYRPQRYPGPLTIFRASIQPEGIEPDPSLGWREYADGMLTVHDTPGTHNSILKEPHLSGLITQLESHLNSLRA